MKYLVLMLLLASSVGAIELNDACASRGYYTLSTWIYNGTYIHVDGPVNVTGTARKLNWTSDTYVDAVVYKSGTRTYLTDGGFNGTIPKTTLSNDIVFVAFCGANAVPEFNTLGAVITVLFGLGIVIYKKR
jgi:hypothetical protein